MSDPFLETAPSPAEWEYPALTFESEKDRRIFEWVLVEKRDAALQVPDHAPQYVHKIADDKVEVLESILDRMGRSEGATAEVVFQSPAELNQSVCAVRYAYNMAEKQLDADRRESVLDSFAHLLAVLCEIHWVDDVAEYLAELEYGGAVL